MSEKTTDAEMEQALHELRERLANEPSKLVAIDGRQFRLGAWYRPRVYTRWRYCLVATDGTTVTARKKSGGLTTFAACEWREMIADEVPAP